MTTHNIGDTWGYGIQSDPYKTAAHRNAQYLRAKCLEEWNCTTQSPYFYNFSRLLLKNGEHTWYDFLCLCLLVGDIHLYTKKGEEV